MAEPPTTQPKAAAKDGAGVSPIAATSSPAVTARTAPSEREDSRTVPVEPVVAAIRAGEDAMITLTRSSVLWTRVMAIAAIVTGCVSAAVSTLQWSTTAAQLDEMKGSSLDTRRLVRATQELAKNSGQEAIAMAELRTAGESQAVSMDRLRGAGEEQAVATHNLATAGERQAVAMRELASGSASQLAALQATAASSRSQAEAALVASRATDRLASSGQAQAKVVAESIEVSREANKIAREISFNSERPWLNLEIDSIRPPEKNQDWIVHTNLVNSGRSPAIEVTVNIEFSISNSPFNFPNLPNPCKGPCQTNTVFPGPSSWGYAPKIPASIMTEDELLKIKDGKRVLVFRSRIDYVDAYGLSHVTYGCRWYDFAKSSFTTCNGGNRAS